MELQDFAREVQQAWHRFLQRTEPLRPDLHRYCRALTGSVWDAEDLVQDTLLRAFAKLSETPQGVENPKAYLFRIASNLWIDRFRRGDSPELEPSALVAPPSRSTEVRDAARRLMQTLPPQERAAVVLKDVFDFHLDEIAATLQTTTGAIKAALHRGREKLALPSGGAGGEAGATNERRPSEALLDAFVEAFNARDLDRVASLLRADAVGEVVSMGAAYGRKAIRDSSLYYSLFLEKGEPRAERHFFQGEPVVVVWYDLHPPHPPEVLDVLRFEELEGEISRLRFFCFCTETLTEIVAALGLAVQSNGYGVWDARFLEMQKQDEFQRWMAQES